MHAKGERLGWTVAGWLVVKGTAATLLVLLLVPTRTFAAPSSAGDRDLFKRLDINGDGLLTAEEIRSDQARLFERLVRQGDTNGDRELSYDEFRSALVPSRPDKPLEPQQPDVSPQVDAVRYVLLSLDTNGDSMIEADEVPPHMQQVFQSLSSELDRNDNGRLEFPELSRDIGHLRQIAFRFVRRERIDVATELKKLEKSQGEAARRFDEPPPLAMLADARQSGTLFNQLDNNADGKIELAELPEPLRPRLERLIRLADRNRDGALTRQEFLRGLERRSRVLGRQQSENIMNSDDARPER